MPFPFLFINLLPSTLPSFTLAFRLREIDSGRKGEREREREREACVQVKPLQVRPHPLPPAHSPRRHLELGPRELVRSLLPSPRAAAWLHERRRSGALASLPPPRPRVLQCSCPRPLLLVVLLLLLLHLCSESGRLRLPQPTRGGCRDLCVDRSDRKRKISYTLFLDTRFPLSSSFFFLLPLSQLHVLARPTSLSAHSQSAMSRRDSGCRLNTITRRSKKPSKLSRHCSQPPSLCCFHSPP